MGDKKHSADFTETSPALADLLLALNDTPDNINIPISDLKTLIQKYVQLDTDGGYEYSAGQLWYDPAGAGCVTADTGISGVRTCIGQENLIPVYNNTGGEIPNGTPLSGSGTYVGGVPGVVEADADNIEHVLGFFGLATHDIPAGTIGLVTQLGAVSQVDTSGYSVAPVYLASGGGLTNTIPTYPTNRLLVGGVTVSSETEGIIGVSSSYLHRSLASRSYSFTSLGVGAGTYWKGGFYYWSGTDANLTQSSPSISWGTSGASYAAHVGICVSGPGSVDTGTVGLRVTGILDSETGTQLAAQTEIITEDITTLTANQMVETVGKFSGQVSLSLFAVTGTPTTYSLDFNYGFSKYEDFKNSKVTITGFEASWLGAAASTLDVALLHHKSTGWTYATSGFTPGNGDICRKTTDQVLAGNTVNGGSGAYKRVDLDTFVQGDDDEGVIIQIITGNNNTVETMDLHINAISEELV